MACDIWLVPLVDVLVHSPENPFAEDLAIYNASLAAHQLPPVPVFRYMPGLSGDVEPVAAFDYESLHYLRRAYLLQLTNLPVTPVDGLGGDYEQLLEMFEEAAERSHLVWHFDHAGAYVPIEFDQPIADDALLAAGGPLGSLHGLLRELEAVAPWIGIDHQLPPIPVRPVAPTTLEGPAHPPAENDGPFARERHAWTGLHAATVRALGQGSMVVFA